MRYDFQMNTIPLPFPPNITHRIVFITGFVLTRATRHVLHVEKNLLNLLKHLRYPPDFGSIRDAQSLVFFVFIYEHLFCWFVFFCFCHGVSSIYLIYEFESNFCIFCLLLLRNYSLNALFCFVTSIMCIY